MSKRRFRVDFEDRGYVVLELENKVIDVVDDEWRSCLYNLTSPEEIAGHIASCLVDGMRLSQLDGWADQPDENARIVLDRTDDEFRVEEVKEILE
jgi:hypothetical protein